MSGKVLLLLFLYFIQGLPYGIQNNFLPVYLRSHDVDLTRINLFRLLQLPWLVKLFWAPLVDRYSTRHRWLFVTVVLESLSCVLCSLYSPESLDRLSIVVLFLCNVFASLQDVSVDAIAVAILPEADIAAGNVAQIVGYKLGAAFAGGVLAMLVGILGWSGLCLILAGIYIEAALFIYVSPVLQNEKGRQQQHQKITGQDDDGSYDDILSDCGDMADNCYEMRCRHRESYSSNSNSSKACDTTVNTAIYSQRSLSSIFRHLSSTVFQPDAMWLVVFLLIYKLGQSILF